MRDTSASSNRALCAILGPVRFPPVIPVPMWKRAMSDTPSETRKYIVGWLTFPPGNRDRFMALIPDYVRACRAEPDCLFFDMNPSVSDPDVVIVSECFTSEDAHAAHLAAPAFQGIWPKLAALAISGRFENVFPGRVVPDGVQFRSA
jgi:quinol monooxygenase YgiN